MLAETRQKNRPPEQNLAPILRRLTPGYVQTQPTRQECLDMAGSRWVAGKEAARYLGVSEGMLEEDRRTGRLGIPFHRIGRTVRYDLNEIDAWVRSGCSNPGSKGQGR